MTLFLSICTDIYLMLFKFSVLIDEFGSKVIKCILMYLSDITICMFDLCFLLDIQ
jgi:hypothetical protein